MLEHTRMLEYIYIYIYLHLCIDTRAFSCRHIYLYT